MLAETADALEGCPEIADAALARLAVARTMAGAAHQVLDCDTLAMERDGLAGRCVGGMMPVLLQIVIAAIPAILAITLHEAAHGYAALALGDDTARRMGRLSLNPLRHVDRVGTLLLPGRAAAGAVADDREGGLPVSAGRSRCRCRLGSSPIRAAG